MSIIGKVGASLVINVAKRIARDQKFKRNGREEVFRLWRSGISYEQARKELRH